MNARRAAALPVYGAGYCVMFLCGVIALLGASVLTLAEWIVHERPRFIV
jgi:hypothetical protein